MRKGDEDERLSEGLSELTTETGSEVVTGQKNREEDEEEQDEEEEDDVEEEDGVLLRRSSARVKNTSVYSMQSTKPRMKAQRQRPPKRRATSRNYTTDGSSKEYPILIDDLFVRDFLNLLSFSLTPS
jgi:hypothetical protein